ncbi:MAG: hypothetical protein GEU82_08425 [Luteitalea sp.]|nr:hypothetical protein [Luteitalea sp.]
MTRVVLILLCATMLHPGPAGSQSLTAEADVTAGYSTDEVAAVATQLRAFGDLKGGIRFYLEGAWARRSEKETDAFAAAYPYGGRVEVIETYGERLFTPGGSLVGVRAGRYRTPFGIAGRSDHAYSGFLRAPLIRYDDYYALSNTFLEHGVDVIVGIPQLYAEASLGAPADVGDVKRRSGFDRVFRVQGYHRGWIVGVSHVRTQPTQPASFARGEARFTGVDVRWTHAGVFVRGEWITGQPFDGPTTDGWYVDGMLHRAAMGPVTALVRVEQLHYNTASRFALHETRLTAGAKVRLPRGLSAQVNLLRQSGDLPEYRPTPIDLALTYSIRLH